MSRANRVLLSVAAVLLVVVITANEAVWLHAYGWLGSRLGLWGSFRLDSTEIRMRSGWYAVEKPSEYKGSGSPAPGLLAFKSEWPKLGAQNQIGITKLDVADAEKLASPGPHIKSTEKFSWGTAMFLRTGNAVLLPEVRVLIASGPGYEGHLREAISDIETIAHGPR